MTPPRALPLYFGPSSRTLFGWLHRPSPELGRNVGILMCSPSGYEAICTHRTYRYFAEAAAARGFPVLRFDYDGTGDSAGRSLDPDRVGHWLNSISAAIDALKARTGVERVCLFGVRVGVTLAAVAAQGRTDIHSMIAFAPVVKVSSYLREIRALSLSRPQTPPVELDIDPDLQEAAGFATTAETRTALGQIDLTNLEAVPAPRVLVMNRDDMATSDAWPQRLIALGAAVEQQRLNGYVDMMRDAHAARVPSQSVEAALNWLSGIDGLAAHGSAAASSPPDNASAEFTDDGHRVRETATFMDQDRLLFGIVCEPAEPRTEVRDVAVLLNSGTIHHIGPSRLYVAISRRCAAKGMAVVRMDVSGVGESGVRAGAAWNAPYSESANVDVREAVEFARGRFPGAKVHLIGLCSGAYHGLKAAVAGVSLHSVVMVNPLTFFWKPGMSLEYADFQITSESSRYARSAATLSSWLKLLRGRVNVRNAMRVFWKRFSVRARNALRDTARLLRIDLHEDLAAELLRVARHRTDMFFVFSASDPGHTMLREQGGRVVEKLARKEKLRVAIVQGADHTFTAHWNRDQLIALLMAHLDRHAAQS
jgi:alpha-beta hydrolase superfamily lysophospholipase